MNGNQYQVGNKVYLLLLLTFLILILLNVDLTYSTYLRFLSQF